MTKGKLMLILVWFIVLLLSIMGTVAFGNNPTPLYTLVGAGFTFCFIVLALALGKYISDNWDKRI